MVWLIAFGYVRSCEAFLGHYLYLREPCFYNTIFAKNFGNNVFFLFGEYVTNKLAKINTEHESQNTRAAFSFISTNRVYFSFLYPFFRNKLVFNLLLNLSGMDSFSLPRQELDSIRLASASFAQRSSFITSFPSFSFSNHLGAEIMVSFSHEQLLEVMLANEAYTLPHSLLKHIFTGKLVNQDLAEQPSELDPALFKELLPKLPANGELKFFLVLGELAMQSFKATSFDQLPQQKVKGASNANLGNGQASSSFAKAISFWAWTACRAPELAEEQAYVISFEFTVQSFAEQHKSLQLGHSLTLDSRGADCQLCFWGKQKLHEQQPTFSSLNIKLDSVMVKLRAFQQIEQLYQSASFDWGGVSSENNLPAHWKLDLQQHPAVYQQLADNLGKANPMAKRIYQELAKADTGAALGQKASVATAAFWKATSKSLNGTLQETLQNVEQLIEQQQAETFFEGDWQEPIPAATSALEEASGRVDGSFGSLQCGEGNLPLHLKLELANKLGSFKP